MENMQKSLTLYLIRHGATSLTPEHRYQGKTDLSLSIEGITQVKKLKKRLVSITFDTIFTSPAKRSRETCDLLFRGKNIPFLIEQRLTEMNFGVWEGYTGMEIQNLYPEQLIRHSKNPFSYAPENGETFDMVLDRVKSWYQDILRQYEEKTLVVVGHGGYFNILLCHLLGITPRTNWQFYIQPASVSQVVIYPQNHVIVKLLNDTCHLREDK